MGNLFGTVVVVLLALVMSFGVFAGNVQAETLVFADWAWESALVHNRIAGYIAEHGFGYDTDYIYVDTVPGVEGMRRGEIDVSMEIWIDNIPEVYESVLEEGTVIDLGPNFIDGPQGWYVPTYVIEGDPERGIEPMAPDLKTVFDLDEYWELFKDPENPRKGRYHNGPTSWVSSEINVIKLETYGLDEYFEAFHTGSQAALDVSIVRAFERGEPWLGIYWEPTWIMGEYDMTLLEEEPYYDACWETGEYDCGYPPVAARVAVASGMLEKAPDFVEFLEQYETELYHSNEALAVMKRHDGDTEAAAEWFLREYEDVWTAWLDDDIAAKVKASLAN